MKVTIKKVNEKYLIQGSIYSDQEIEIDGKRIKEFKNGWMSKKPETIKIIQRKKRAINYGELSPEEYKIRMDELNAKRDTYGDFTNIDDEYAYKKFAQDHVAEYEDYEEYEDPEIVEYEITGRTDNDYITPFRFLGKDEVKDEQVLYQYVPNPYKMAQKIASDMGFQEVEDKTWGTADTKGMKWSVPSHSRKDLRFTHINGSYSDYERLGSFYGVTCGSWDECYKMYESHITKIKGLFDKELKKINSEGMKYDKAKVIGELEKLEKSVRSISAKARSDVRPFDVAQRIRNLIDEL